MKGGIDPAGADEHWKTARSALDRINQAFDKKNFEKKPVLIFVGAAIEISMANEIFDLLDAGWLGGAANLFHENQVREVIDILLKL